MSKSWLVRAMLLLCVMAQGVAVMPHHHHGDSNRICLNFFHTEHDDCNCGNHHDRANHQPISACNHKIVIATPSQEKIEISTPRNCSDEDGVSHNIFRSVYDSQLRQRVVPLLRFDSSDADFRPSTILYIARVLSRRAPDSRA